MLFLAHFSSAAGIVTASLLGGAAVLHLLPKIEGPSKSLSTALCRAPGIDWLMTYFTVLPLIAGAAIFGWAGFLGAIVGQVAGVLIWTQIHEWTHREAASGPRIFKIVNHLIGRWQNHTALWLTAIVTPLFWVIRVAEILLYPPLQMLTKFPKYKQGDWVNVSRHKFSGLVGQDLIWCLYCDWMTGVWSLGTEMLRNVESFWCPIRFRSDRKCENCAVDFPDIADGWVDAEGNMKDVTNVLIEKHSDGVRGWFGHPVRLTVKGAELVEQTP